jgi:hypothetical protein
MKKQAMPIIGNQPASAPHVNPEPELRPQWIQQGVSPSFLALPLAKKVAQKVAVGAETEALLSGT